MENVIELSGGLLRQVQLTELEILKAITSFLEENGLSYCLSSGTLLGAVRHGGFIPWDDDVDISMPRADFERLLSMADRLPEGLTLQATRLEEAYPLMMAKVRKDGTIMRETATASLPIHHGVWIDIFPLDRVKHENRLLRRAKIIALLTTAIYYRYGMTKPKPHTALLCRLLGLFGVRRLDAWRTRVMMAEERTDGTLYTSFASNLGCKRLLFSEEVYVPFRRMPFEDADFFVPNQAEVWLQAAYGDFRTPPSEEKRKNVHRVQELKL